MNELDNTKDTLAFLVRELMRRLPPEGAYPPDEEGDLTNLSFYYRIRAIADYLSTGDTTAYIHDLHRSGQARLYYLRGCAAGATGTPRFNRTSRNRAFFDTLAIGDLPTAESLALLCDGRWTAHLEYEDDFLFVHFMQLFFLSLRGARDASAPAVALGRLVEVLEGAESPFFALCRSLQARDAAGFERSLDLAMQKRASNYREAAELGDLPAIFLTTERFVDVQAIGIVRIAALANLPLTKQEYLRIPRDLLEIAGGRHQVQSAPSWRHPG